MTKKKKLYKGVIDAIPNKEVILNITELEDGNYILKIVHKNKILKHTTFKK